MDQTELVGEPHSHLKHEDVSTLSEIKNSFVYSLIALGFAIFIIQFGLMYFIETYLKLSPIISSIVDPALLMALSFPILYFTVIRSMAKQMRAYLNNEAKSKRAMLYDALTNLPNRQLLRDHLELAIKIAQRDKHPIVLLLLDISQLQEINDTLGHRFGDQILQDQAKRLLSRCRKSDTIGRLGSDEFLVIMPKAGLYDALEMGIKLNQWMDDPLVIQGVPISIEVSIGIAVYPDHGVEPDDLLRKVDIALRNAKNHKEEISVYNESNDRHNLKQLGLVSELRSALSNDDFFLNYQPKVDLKSGKLSGVEALVRWQHSERGIVSPDSFIPTVEKTGLIKPFTLMTLVKAAKQCKQWQLDQMHIKVAVNLSARLLLDKTLPDQIEAILEHEGLSPDLLELELTESAIMANPQLAKHILNRLRNMGVTFSIDDFGTGYTSLSYLSELPISLLKIDRCFIKDMLSNNRHAVITKSIIKLGHNLGLKVIAEGVEDEATCNRLKDLGCDMIQGYYFSKPLSAVSLVTWISEQIPIAAVSSHSN